MSHFPALHFSQVVQKSSKILLVSLLSLLLRSSVFLVVLGLSLGASVKSWWTPPAALQSPHCALLLNPKATTTKQGFRGDDLPSDLGGMNPRMEGNLDSTGAERESNHRITKLEKTSKAIKPKLWPNHIHQTTTTSTQPHWEVPHLLGF